MTENQEGKSSEILAKEYAQWNNSLKRQFARVYLFTSADAALDARIRFNELMTDITVSWIEILDRVRAAEETEITTEETEST